MTSMIGVLLETIIVKEEVVDVYDGVDVMRGSGGDGDEGCAGEDDDGNDEVKEVMR